MVIPQWYVFHDVSSVQSILNLVVALMIKYPTVNIQVHSGQRFLTLNRNRDSIIKSSWRETGILSLLIG